MLFIMQCLRSEDAPAVHGGIPLHAEESHARNLTCSKRQALKPGWG